MTRKRFVALLLVVCCLTVFAPTFSLAEASEATAPQNARMVTNAFLTRIGRTGHTIQSEYKLLNSGGNLEAICFSLAPSGYIIVNTNDWSIPEFSPSAPCPYSGGGVHYYNGLFNYDGPSVLTRGSTGNTYTKPKKNFDPTIHANAKVARRATERRVNGTLRTWGSDSVFCAVDASAIWLMYYQDYKAGTYVPTAYRSYSSLTNYLIGNYLVNDPMDVHELVNGKDTFYIHYTGLTGYFNDNVSGTSRMPDFDDFAFPTIRNYIAQNDPVMVLTYPFFPQFDNWAHWCIAYGYYEDPNQAEQSRFLIVNDDLGNNEVWISGSNLDINKMIYLS